MNFTVLLLAIPLSFGSGVVLADSVTTSSETTISKPSMPSVETRSSERATAPNGVMTEKHSATKENPDGSKSSASSSTVIRP